MAASVAQLKHKREHEKLNEDDQNLQKRSRAGLLSELSSTDDDAVEDDLVLQAIKNLEEEINGASEMGKTSRLSGEVEERVGSCEDVMNATSDQQGNCEEENDNEGISSQFWSDLFENPSTSRGQTVDVLHPFLSHCYSYNYRDYVEYNTLFLSEDQQEWIREAFKDLASQKSLALL